MTADGWEQSLVASCTFDQLSAQNLSFAVVRTRILRSKSRINTARIPLFQDRLARFTKYDHEPPKPEPKWDFFGIGGRFEGALPLKQPRKLRRFFGLLPAGDTIRVSIAKKFEIDQHAFLAEPPAALFFRNQLYECPLFAEGEVLEKWQTEFRQRFAEIPDDTTLQIVDAHS